MDIEAIKLFSKVYVDPASLPREEYEHGWTDNSVAALNLEISAFGYTLGSDLIEALHALSPDQFIVVRDDMHKALCDLSGANKSYVRLFKGFPYDIPDQRVYFLQRVTGHLENLFGIRATNDLTHLSCGHFIDGRLFDLEKFGACPICQYQVAELTVDDLAPSSDVYTPLKVLGLLTPAEAMLKGNTLLRRQSSLSADEKAFLARRTDLTLPDVIFKETLPFAYTMFGPKVISLLSGATDLMRIAAYLSDETADLSLKENVRFKLKRADAHNILQMLDQLGNLEEDMLRNRERWLRLGEKLKPSKHAARYPNAAKAFDALRNAPESIPTFARDMEKGLRSKTVDATFVAAMVRRPGEFARKLDFMLRTASSDETGNILLALIEVAKRLPEATLFNLRKYLRSRDVLDQRIFLPKGAVNKAQVVEDKRRPIDKKTLQDAASLIELEIVNRASLRAPMGKVYIDPVLEGMVVPFNRRGDSSTTVAIPKGSAVPFEGDFVRLFVYWVGHIDVDLSIVLMDEDFVQMGHIAYTNLHGWGCVHSGDIRSAPNGASEFIDFPVDRLLDQGVRYVMSSIISFGGNQFSTFECFAGFMEREAVGSKAIYDPKTVAVKFDLNAPNTSHMPFIFDLKDRKMVFVDMASGNMRFGAVARQSNKSTTLTRAMMSLNQRKPTLGDVVFFNAVARGTVVDTPEEADICFGPDDIEKIANFEI